MKFNRFNSIISTILAMVIAVPGLFILGGLTYVLITNQSRHTQYEIIPLAVAYIEGILLVSYSSLLIGFNVKDHCGGGGERLPNKAM